MFLVIALTVDLIALLLCMRRSTIHSLVATLMSLNQSTKAKDEVFATPELLEAILFCAKVRDLAVARRVNKQWRATIEQSPLLQEALFLEPMNQPMVIPNYKDVYWGGAPPIVDETDETVMPNILQNPLMDRYMLHLPLLAEAGRGNWMETFVCQPPARKLPLWIKWDHGIVRHCTIWREHGVKIKDVVDVVEGFLEDKIDPPDPPAPIRYMEIRCFPPWSRME